MPDTSRVACCGRILGHLLTDNSAETLAGHVIHDSLRAAEFATRHLIEAGHRRLLHRAGRSDG